ncbi:hypothetical protein [Methanimicrococcus hacksteinii]|uniref:hypothetical protein n=1 Tax=Methanimicrococcus hacksteinii TaxID=3028293 RepID=UPI00298EFF30|nr:hypothetical protein [Methanimicrococcus sp. At1]
MLLLSACCLPYASALFYSSRSLREREHSYLTDSVCCRCLTDAVCCRHLTDSACRRRQLLTRASCSVFQKKY